MKMFTLESSDGIMDHSEALVDDLSSHTPIKRELDHNWPDTLRSVVHETRHALEPQQLSRCMEHTMPLIYEDMGWVDEEEKMPITPCSAVESFQYGNERDAHLPYYGLSMPEIS